jgi:hypothetical protein
LFTPFSYSNSGDLKITFLKSRTLIHRSTNLKLGLATLFLLIAEILSAQVHFAEQKSDYSISVRSFPSVPSRWYEVESDTGSFLLFNSIDFGYPAKGDSGEFQFGILPLLEVGAGYSNKSDELFEASGGVALGASVGKFSLHAEFIGGINRQPGYLVEFTDSLGILPSRGRNLSTSESAAFAMPTLALNFKANEFFTFELGYGKNFFGNGHRSLFLSDVAYNYPYLRIETSVWHIKYINLFSALQDISADPSDPSSFRNKFSSSHYFNWAISPRFNIGLFETIIWQGSDTLSDRGFDPNYLNPIIFFRPVEFSIGSPDNAIIGLDLSFKLSKKSILYGQLIFDEFLLSEFRARDGWWGNKWGAQFGLKTFDPFGLSNAFLRGEFNLARPFTYTHGSVLQNFGHYNQPLAHPLGTNFYEGLIQAYYEKDDWFFEGQWNYSLYGRDPDSLNFGGDIYRSYANPAEIYGNEIGQGRQSRLFYQKLSAGIILNRRMNLRASAYYVYRRLDEDGMAINNEHIFGVRLATELFRTYTDF